MLSERPAWQARAACRGVDPSLFFPETRKDSDTAMKICAGCPVRLQCLDFAIVTREAQGVWGGTNERQRRKMIHLRRLGAS